MPLGEDCDLLVWRVLRRALMMFGGRLKLLYDGECPICRRAVGWLSRRDREGRLRFEDFAALGFDPAKYGLSRDEVARMMHAVTADGRVLQGMDAIREALKAVGLGWILAPSRLPVLRTVTDCAYRVLSRFRTPLSSLIGGGCPHGTCAVGFLPLLQSGRAAKVKLRRRMNDDRHKGWPTSVAWRPRRGEQASAGCDVRSCRVSHKRQSRGN
jgi:predicted DCC family thiol-disulfide oxidoreductase YuxK